MDDPTTETINDPFYVARATVDKVAGLHRRATIPGGVTVDFGVHGPVKSHYGLDDADDLPLPVDYVVAAAGG